MTGARQAPLRRVPVQQRSAARVERMLSACAELIHEHGYDGVTTTMIAKRAGVAVGSLYQFFPDKRAVAQAITQRNLDHFIGAIDAQLTTLDEQHWWQVADAIFDIYLDMHRTVPAFSQLHFGDVIDLRLLDDRMDNNAVISAKLGELLRGKMEIDPSEYELPIAVAVEAADAVLKFAFRHDPQGDQRVVDEAKAMIKGYLAARLPG
ncbi:TetR family transcriptional regulator [Tamaricihabitans halophyticus]|uniref:TetR family transcriptional regulator n=1 Tax=Tamaricihabitans halophyticus TaxID=1262583 RepID=A0A4R2QVJ6_9PSEU|nr:TetR/AcrR family transcriptional regulator [Tamaricihabitans halophyticus]TCP54080.1 TetR family transcriptional regulator [Tamaricihabitans halophyticus]